MWEGSCGGVFWEEKGGDPVSHRVRISERANETNKSKRTKLFFFFLDGGGRKTVTHQLRLVWVVILQPGKGWCLTTRVAPRGALIRRVNQRRGKRHAATCGQHPRPPAFPQHDGPLQRRRQFAGFGECEHSEEVHCFVAPTAGGTVQTQPTRDKWSLYRHEPGQERRHPRPQRVVEVLPCTPVHCAESRFSRRIRDTHWYTHERSPCEGGRNGGVTGGGEKEGV